MLSKLKKWEIPISITMVFFGIMLTTQFKTQQAVLHSLENQKEDDLVVIIKNLNDKRFAVLTELEDLQKQKVAIVDKAKAGGSIVPSMDNDLRKLKMITGNDPIQGAGVTVSITTSDTPIMYLDLVDIINELWSIGAESVSVNDIRITGTTSITDIQDGKKTSVAINGSKLLSPITIEALGDPNTLVTGLNFPKGVIENLSTLYNIHPDIRRETNIVIPAAK